MTREEAIEEIRDTFTDEWADEMIKALEQEPILDKLRAEIENLKRFEIREEKTSLVNGDKVLQIIDKYKAESEDT